MLSEAVFDSEGLYWAIGTGTGMPLNFNSTSRMDSISSMGSAGWQIEG
jgi:hypothetical protein